jgi:hypothetical protein
MRLLLVVVGWMASLFAALVGVIFSFGAIHSPLEWPVAVACFVFALAVNPLAIRKMRMLQKPKMVTAIAIGAFIFGTASLVGSITHDANVQAQKAAQEQSAAAAAQKVEADKAEASFKTLVTSMMPMDDATYELVKTAGTADVDPDNAAGLRSYFVAQLTLFPDLGGNTDQEIRERADDLVRAAQTEPSVRASMVKMNSASRFARTIAIVDSMKAHDTFRRMAESK